MVSYDFDKIIDRRNTDCLKYDFAVQRGRPQDFDSLAGQEFVASTLKNAIQSGKIAHAY